uniref:WBP2 N-terminal like n=1 Tax=Sinocyclocheilus grahami TaxID=75366 RepID=A0A672N9L2_SINGR
MIHTFNHHITVLLDSGVLVQGDRAEGRMQVLIGNLNETVGGVRVFQMVFVSSTMKEKFCSLMFPYYLMKNCSIEQPVFAANYIQGLIKAEAGGGWEGQANFKMSFPSGGAIDLGQHLFKLATNASRAPPAQNGAFGLAAGMNGYASPAMPQPYPYPYPYPSMPQVRMGVYPSAPMYMAPPPPYPGPPQDWCPPPAAPGNTKAAEAASSAFYNPSNPHSVYIKNNDRWIDRQIDG